VTDTPIPYGRQSVEEDDVEAVVDALRSDWLTTGPRVRQFEEALERRTGAPAAVVSSGTAALHLAYAALDIGPGDEVITSPLTFAATATAALALGASVRFADIDEATGNIDPELIEVGDRTRAITVVDYAGSPVDVDAVRARTGELPIVADAAHSVGAELRGRPVGTLATLTTLSFHPVKTFTTAEGGAVLGDPARVERVRRLRSHGMEKNEDTAREGPWAYEIKEIGFNYRITDLQCALGISQMNKLDRFLERRAAIAARYDEALRDVAALRLPTPPEDVRSAWHLYVVRVQNPARRRAFFERLHARGIRVQVHYVPVYWHPIFAERGFTRGLCPQAEAFYAAAISLPIYPGLSDDEQSRCIDVVREEAKRVL
jgi:UDP-4-amino-4,6-dideoxy-N-acetyl-beta-L-altrosamine transaminase